MVTGFIAEYQGAALVIKGQQVLSIVQARAGEPAIQPQVFALDQHRFGVRRQQCDTAEVQVCLPELLTRLDTPLMQLCIAVEAQLPGLQQPAAEVHQLAGAFNVRLLG